MENHIKNYNDLMYDNGPVKFNDYILNKYNVIHNELYDTALQKLCKAIHIDYHTIYSQYKLIEIKNTEFYLPSKVILITTTFPFSKKTYDLTPYWPEYVFNKYTYNDILFDNEKYKNMEIIYIDYVKGTITLQSRQNDIVVKVGFDLIDPDSVKIGEEYSLNNLFSFKITN